MRNPYHIVTISPWPILMSLNLLCFLIIFVGFLNSYIHASFFLTISFLSILYILFLWMKDIIIESNLGFHTYLHSKSLVLGFVLFCITEIMLFFSLFWAYFYNAFNPLYLIWPPLGILAINPYSIPLFNTVLLFWGGLAATAAHHYYLGDKYWNTLFYLYIALCMTVIFFLSQLFEFIFSNFDITDSVYGTSFFVLTGLHGLHMGIAIIVISILLIRINLHQMSEILLNLVLLYFHILDAIWILLFILIYIN